MTDEPNHHPCPYCNGSGVDDPPFSATEVAMLADHADRLEELRKRTTWTRERPTRPGSTYWCYWPTPQFDWQHGPPRVCTIDRRGGFLLCGEEDHMFGVMDGAMFAGPIEPPPLPDSTG